jgi:hypothetical protein
VFNYHDKKLISAIASFALEAMDECRMFEGEEKDLRLVDGFSPFPSARKHNQIRIYCVKPKRQRLFGCEKRIPTKHSTIHNASIQFIYGEALTVRRNKRIGLS